LNREGTGDSACSERLDQWFADAELGERLICGHVDGAFQASVVARRRDGPSRGKRHKLARLPAGNIDRREKSLCGCTDHPHWRFRSRELRKYGQRAVGMMERSTTYWRRY
jgi:hypothetical protein